MRPIYFQTENNGAGPAILTSGQLDFHVPVGGNDTQIPSEASGNIDIMKWYI